MFQGDISVKKTGTETMWTETKIVLPQQEQVVVTKVHDDDGERHIRRLKMKGRLWFTEDGTIYVPCVPTHWRSK